MAMTPREEESWKTFWLGISVASLAAIAFFFFASCATTQHRRIVYVDCGTTLTCMGYTGLYSEAVIVSADTLAGDCVCKDDPSEPEWAPCGGCVPR